MPGKQTTFTDLNVEALTRICACGLDMADLHNLFALSQSIHSLVELRLVFQDDKGVTNDHAVLEWLKRRTWEQVRAHWAEVIAGVDGVKRERQYALLTHPDMCPPSHKSDLDKEYRRELQNLVEVHVGNITRFTRFTWFTTRVRFACIVRDRMLITPQQMRTD